MTTKGDINRDKVLIFLVDFEKKFRRLPTYREVAGVLKLEVSHVFKMVKQLAEAGLVRSDPGKSRAISILKLGYQHVRMLNGFPRSYVDRQTVDVVNIQFRGSIAAGEPISFLPYTDPENVVQVLLSQFPKNVKIEECFALKVQGNSMIDDGIYNGDTVILKQTETAENGDTVAAWLEEYECTTLKRYHVNNNGQVHLIPRNQTMQPIEVKRPDLMRIQGKLVYILSQ
jgi:repressor LexA